LALAVEEAGALGAPLPFLFPSSIAVCGLPDLATKRAAAAVAEEASSTRTAASSRRCWATPTP
jgi:hypothetical protein